ncbi:MULTISPECIES: WXG100 family type VII secretion target [Streptococcus]|uniref:WXG100 family type VII secretion target n=1 Tax=Streptococcus TaxID=1301 RepID=UPI0003805699|nr:WXG100 family type VII secretion target [Streptococcus thoraltensis]NQM14367.1 WXG100 family type VII secretion target [Streptococcus suis]
MATIKLTPEELRQSAVQYSNGSQTVTDVLTTLTNEQAVISENWEGSAFDSFEQQFNELSPKIQEFAELLTAINQQLNSVATTLEETDSQMASQIYPGS